jgi:penicillin amidase
LKVAGNAASLQQYLDILRSWLGSGAHRLDKDQDGAYDDRAAVALMDEWWPRLIHAMFDPTLGDLYGSVPMAFDDHPGPVGSAFLDGWYGYVEKAARMALGDPVQGPYSVFRCADGTLAGCRAAVRQSLHAAVDALGADPGQWDSNGHIEKSDAIEFVSVGLVSVPDIPWQNRPTFQQVVEVTEHRPG